MGIMAFFLSPCMSVNSGPESHGLQRNSHVLSVATGLSGGGSGKWLLHGLAQGLQAPSQDPGVWAVAQNLRSNVIERQRECREKMPVTT